MPNILRANNVQREKAISYPLEIYVDLFSMGGVIIIDKISFAAVSYGLDPIGGGNYHFPVRNCIDPKPN